MEQIAKAEPSRRQGESLEQVAERFRHWRETRIRGEHVPSDLWAAAVGLAKEHGLQRIAHALRVDHDGLKRRVERAMIQITPHMRILVAVEPIDFRAGIDGLAGACRRRLEADPFSGCLFVFGNRARTAIKILVYDSC